MPIYVSNKMVKLKLLTKFNDKPFPFFEMEMVRHTYMFEPKLLTAVRVKHDQADGRNHVTRMHRPSA